MRASLIASDPAFERTKWILQTGAKIIVSLDGAVVSDVQTADEETGCIAVQEGKALLFKKGKVHIRVSLR